MKKLLILCMLSCAACTHTPMPVVIDVRPAPNTDPELFADVYDALAQVTTLEQDLETVRILTLPEIELHDLCGLVNGFTPIEAARCWGFYSRGWDLVVLPEPPDSGDYCEIQPGSGLQYAEIVIHELAHLTGLDHGQELDDVVDQALEIYRERMCP